MNMLEVTSLVQNSILLEIVIIIIIATLFAYLSKLIKQPLIPAYIITGIILGPIGLGIIRDTEVIRQLSEFGIAFLLFVVGLEIDIKKLKDIGLVSSIGGIAQIILTYFAGYIVASYLGFSNLTSIYVGLILTFSSTMIVIKLISEKRQIDTLNGRISLGILLIQDLVVIGVFSFLSSLGSFSFAHISFSITYALILVILGILLSLYILPTIFNYAAKSEELLFLVSITTCFFFIIIAYLMNLSVSIGAFIAGISIGTLPYNREVIGRVTPLRDFFSVIFFVFLGIQILLFNESSFIQAMIIFLLLIIIVKPFIIFIITNLFGYDKRVSFLTGLSLGQVSEFSLILAAQGLYLGHISKEMFSLTILLTVISMIVTSYTSKYENFIYNKMSTFLGLFEKLSFTTKKFEYAKAKSNKKIIIFGCHRMGSVFLNTVKKLSKDVLIVDHNPEIIKDLIKEKIPCLYGDINNPEILDSIDLKNTKLIISTIPNVEANSFLIEHAKAINPKIMIFATSDQIKDSFELYDCGADYVILPHLTTAEILSGLIKDTLRNRKSLEKTKKQQLKYIEHLKYYGC